MTESAIRSSCSVWRHDRLFATTEGALVLNAADEVSFVADGAMVWSVPASQLEWKHPWYSRKASLKVTAPKSAQGLFMAYPPRSRTSVGAEIDVRRAQQTLKPFADRLRRAQRS
ncbi:MAG: hypothetical protein AB8G14_05535 [Ilumatobacter sp.]